MRRLILNLLIAVAICSSIPNAEALNREQAQQVINNMWFDTVNHYPQPSDPEYHRHVRELVCLNHVDPVIRKIVYSREAAESLVRSFYIDYLARAPEPGVLTRDAAFIRQGGSSNEILHRVIASEEYFFLRNAGDSQRWLENLYRNLLYREPAQDEINAWLNAIATGMSRSEVTTVFLNSLERRQWVVRIAYILLLGRDPDPAGLTAWSERLAGGMSPEQLRIRIMNSTEYWSRHSSVPKPIPSSSYLAGVWFDHDLIHAPGGDQPWLGIRTWRFTGTKTFCADGQNYIFGSREDPFATEPTDGYFLNPHSTPGYGVMRIQSRQLGACELHRPTEHCFVLTQIDTVPFGTRLVGPYGCLLTYTFPMVGTNYPERAICRQELP